MRRLQRTVLAALLAGSSLSLGATQAQTASRQPSGPDPLQLGFQEPPDSAKPRVWWHWMNGNITKDGIRKDLQWMKRSGIGGAQAFDANEKTPQIVDNRLIYMTPEWKDAFHYAAATADELGLELAIASSAGWSETGGPWVAPEDGMKKLVWSELLVRGGKPVAEKIAPAADVTGPYRDLPAEVSSGRETPRLYRDIRVLAYRISEQKPMPTPRISGVDGKPIDAAALLDDRLTTSTPISAGSREHPNAIVLEYDTAQTIRSATLYAPGAEATPFRGALRPRLEASDDGRTWRKVAEFTITSTAPSTISFEPVTAKAYRLVLAPPPATHGSSPPLPAGVDLSALARVMGGSGGLRIAELRLSREPKVHQFEAKAGFATAPDYHVLSTEIGDHAGVRPNDVVDITARVRPDGAIDWTPPRGDWRIVRLGWSLIGKVNHPATDEATGLEVDKMDAAAVRRYLEQYLGRMADASGQGMLGARGVRAMVTDSTEVGPFNWTADMIDRFKELRGYDPTPWLPALTGAIIGSRGETDRFLYDFRRTIADLHATAHYGTVAKVAHEHGLRLYGEALENGRPSLGDDMSLRSYADYPMAAMWFIPRGVPLRSNFLADMKGASSVAHVYGQNIAAAESLTSALMPYATAPADLRQIIDLEFAFGINRPVIHTSVHQPVDDKVPGLSLGIFGQYFTRHETWAEMARPWMDYVSRSAFMLQQGRNVADVAYFYGEDAPLTELYADGLPVDAPRRYAYDFINADALTRLLSVESDELVTAGGARYRALYLGGSSRQMTLPVLRRIAELAQSGATIVGEAPTASPSLKDDPVEYAKLKALLWGGQPVTQVGKGQVVAGAQIEAALASMRAAPDFDYAGDHPDSELLFAHRELPDGHVYFVSNRKFRDERLEARFRVAGKAPEIWRAETGRAEPVSYRIDGDVTVVPLEMAPEESFFVVFRKPAAATNITVAKPLTTTVTELKGPWTVAFQANRGAPRSIRLERLQSLSENPDPGVKYFSGVASYRQTFTLPKGPQRPTDLFLDLGAVADLAEVRVNGEPVGIAWRSPYRVALGAAVRPGKNQLEVRVANLWVNRLIGDAQPGARRITFTAMPTYTAKAPLRKSGLLGPVTILSQTSGQD